MNQKRAKRIRRLVRSDYNYSLERWKWREPPRWRFISHWLWMKDKPKMPKEVREQ